MALRNRSDRYAFRKFPCERIPLNVSLTGSSIFRQDSTEFRRKFPLKFRLESVGKEMAGIRQKSTKNASDPTQLLTDPTLGMLDLGLTNTELKKVFH